MRGFVNLARRRVSVALALRILSTIVYAHFPAMLVALAFFLGLILGLLLSHLRAPCLVKLYYIKNVGEDVKFHLKKGCSQMVTPSSLLVEDFGT